MSSLPRSGEELTYDFMVITTGVKVRLDKVTFNSELIRRLTDLQIEGLTDAFNDPDCPVSTAYLPHGAEKTYRYLSSLEAGKPFFFFGAQRFALSTLKLYVGLSQGGEFLFTFPATPIKCAGAPQKVCYIADDVSFQEVQKIVIRKKHAAYVPLHSVTSLSPRFFALAACEIRRACTTAPLSGASSE